MASAVLSPGAPSSFLVRALTSWGEERLGGEPLARSNNCLVHAHREGPGKGRFPGPKESFGVGGGARAREKSGGKRQKGIWDSAAAVPVLTVARPRDRCCARKMRDAQGLAVSPRLENRGPFLSSRGFK
ncbi:recQ-mediated genome instability protein 1 isoform X3 [Chlorocebus sabaeus]|uniref:recQ-mediated genome instability protein 1 isoform X3 n=1 Tax=Chlorocebus sabaeus TaxID=60711 RepID=UPI003BF993CA